MNHPFVWYFALNIDDTPSISAINLNDYPIEDDRKWEKRFFFTDKETIILNGLSFDYLNLNTYTFKTHKDCYLLTPTHDINLKIRHDKFIVKPQVAIVDNCYCYSKKEKFNLPQEYAFLARVLPDCKHVDDIKALTRHFDSHYQKINVFKDALIHHLDKKSKVKFELSRLTINKSYYYSLCIETKNKQLLELLAKSMVPKNSASNYVHFLKGISLC
jgi:hypothetical protein